MIHGREDPLLKPLFRRAPAISYRSGRALPALAENGTLAVFSFGANSALPVGDPRCLQVALEPLDGPAPLELWQVDAPVDTGRTGDVRWSRGGGWLFAAIELDEAEHGGPSGAAESAYRQLHQLLDGSQERNVLRVWNYLADINQGEGDAERYKHFCEGRARGMGTFFIDGFPAATAIGHHAAVPRLQVYLLACDQPGQRIENPRQVSAWQYPRQYGRTAPTFARAMALPGEDALAISGTAAVVGHASAHHEDLDAQLEETLTNLEALLASAGMPAGFDTQSPLKVYVRHPRDASRVGEFLAARLPAVPTLLLHGDICRSELLVEIDGWRYG